MRRSTRHGSKIDEAPDTMDFVGRADDLAVLLRWVLDEHCRVVAVLGIGGVGKTNLAARLAQDVAPSFERVYWRSLRNAPAISEWLAGAIAFVSDQQLAPPTAVYLPARVRMEWCGCGRRGQRNSVGSSRATLSECMGSPCLPTDPYWPAASMGR
jgi:hypothetical protein